MKQEPKENAKQRIRDAEEFLESAKENVRQERFKAGLDNAVDAAIAANDAFTIWLVQQVGSTDHREAIRIHLLAGKKISENKSQTLKRLLDLRHKMTYRAVKVPKGMADETLRDAIGFVGWVREKMKL